MHLRKKGLQFWNPSCRFYFLRGYFCIKINHALWSKIHFQKLPSNYTSFMSCSVMDLSKNFVHNRMQEKQCWSLSIVGAAMWKLAVFFNLYHWRAQKNLVQTIELPPESYLLRGSLKLGKHIFGPLLEEINPYFITVVLRQSKSTK